MKYITIFLFLFLLLFSCAKNDYETHQSGNYYSSSGWLVDTNKMTGTRINDVFPLITNPIYTNPNDVKYHDFSERVIVFKIEETIFIYPIWMMGVEVVNDSLNNFFFSVTYCPKTNTTYVFNREVNNKVHTFRASGVLYQDNLVYYDLQTESFWSQMLFKSIYGAHAGESPKIINSFETTFSVAKEYFPDAKVFIDFPKSKEFSTSTRKKTYPQPENLILGILDHILKPGSLSIIDFTQLNDKEGLITSENILIVYNKDYKYINAFISKPKLTFFYTDDFPNVLKDGEGNTWDAFGYAIDGPQKGEKLDVSVSFLAYWWAWQGIYDSFYHIGT